MNFASRAMKLDIDNCAIVEFFYKTPKPFVVICSF